MHINRTKIRHLYVIRSDNYQISMLGTRPFLTHDIKRKKKKKKLHKDLRGWETKVLIYLRWHMDILHCLITRIQKLLAPKQKNYSKLGSTETRKIY